MKRKLSFEEQEALKLKQLETLKKYKPPAKIKAKKLDYSDFQAYLTGLNCTTKQLEILKVLYLNHIILIEILNNL